MRDVMSRVSWGDATSNLRCSACALHGVAGAAIHVLQDVSIVLLTRYSPSREPRDMPRTYRILGRSGDRDERSQTHATWHAIERSAGCSARFLHSQKRSECRSIEMHECDSPS